MIDERVIVEKLDVKRGELVLVVIPDEMPDDYWESVSALFDDLARELGAFFFLVPGSLKFKVVRASEAQ